MSITMTATTPIECIGGDNPPELPERPRIAPRTRKPVRIIGAACWSERAIRAVAAIYHTERATAGQSQPAE